MKKKRKRGDNWVSEDKDLLKELVKGHVNAIENKNTDTNTNQNKKRIWVELQENFNNLCQGCPRTITQLKSQWTTMKIQAKKEVSEHRREVIKTGGGPQPVDQVIDSNEISVWLPNEFVVDTNEFDSDAVIHEISSSVLEEVQAMNSKKEEDNTIKNSEKIENETPEIPIIIQEDEIQENNKRTNKDKLDATSTRKKKKLIHKTNVHDEKIKTIADLEMQCRKELHLLQVENEKKKGLNLDLEHELLKTKIMVYKKQLDENDVKKNC